MLNFGSKDKSATSARVVDGKLILSCPQAVTPVVWQMDLNDVKASAIEVHADDGTGQYTIALKAGKKATEDIAAFSAREEAVECLNSISYALENSYGKIRGGQDSANGHVSAAYAPPPKQRKPGRWIIAILAIILLAIAFNMWGSQAPRAPGSFQQQSSAGFAAQQNTNPSSTAGVPVSADDFLNGL